jgi:putative ABC transport system substrate-binding protein
MRRREFIAGLGSAAAWPMVARAQQPERMRRIGVFMNFAENDTEGRRLVAAFVQELQLVGWIDGRNMRIDYRWTAGDAERLRRYASELVALAPDVILASGGTIVGQLQQLSQTVPIVFGSIIDPVAGGFVASLARPAGNATGFADFEYGMGAKWFELLKQIAPGVTRVAALRDPGSPAGGGQLGAIQAATSSNGVELRPLNPRNVADIESAISAFARGSRSGLIVPASPLAIVNRELIIALSARHLLPTVYSYRYFVAGGGLISYGPDEVDQFRRAAGYVDRILKGEKPADLPVQTPSKYEMVINLKTAKALGLTIPETLLATADEVIQ